ncbi:MAG: hypothetical protein KY433_09905 [Actinobacteria bacterium]|nr:hypothetical protein [Actinomycetota bacterium]
MTTTSEAREQWSPAGVYATRVAIGATVSGFVGLVAASLPGGSHVIVPEEEFTSTLFSVFSSSTRSATSP